MNTCKTCKWWDRGCCDQQHAPHLSAKLKVVDDDPELNEMPRHDQLLVRIQEAASGIILTGPDFGCIHHEARP